MGSVIVTIAGVHLTQRFHTPPNWPDAPEGWVPPEGWQPDPAWGPAPAGWQFWVDDITAPDTALAAPWATQTASQPLTDGDEKVSIFKARGRVRELSAEVSALRGQLEQLGALTVADLDAQAATLRGEVAQLRADLQIEREQHAAALAQEAADARRRTAQDLERLSSQREEAAASLAELQRQVVVTQEEALLQEAGVYTYRHPLSGSSPLAWCVTATA